MTFTNDTAANAAFKRLYGRAHTSNSKDIVNEDEPSGISIAAQAIFADTIVPVAQDAVSDGVAAAVSIPLVIDSSSNGKAYKATITGSVPAALVGKTNPLTGSPYTTGDRVGYFIPEFLGSDYRIILMDGVTEVPPLSTEDWIFDYYSGIVTSEDNLSLSSGTVDGYVYIGALASDTAANWMRDGLDIYNRNLGTVIIKNDLVVEEDGYISGVLGVSGDGYFTNHLGVGTSNLYDQFGSDTRLYIEGGNLTLQDTGGSNVPNITIRSNYSGANDTLGSIYFGSTLSSDPNKRTSMISGLVSSPADADAGKLVFATSDANGTLINRVYIDEDGYLGVGINNPDTLVHIQSTLPATIGSTQGSLIRLDYNDTSWTTGDVIGALEWSGNDASAGASGVRARVQAVAASGTGSTDIRLLTTGASSATLNTILAVTGTQRVGILTSSPDTTLHVMQSDASASSSSSAIATFERSGNGYLQILTPDANENGVLFGLASGASHGAIIYNSAPITNGIQLRVNNNVTKLVLTSNGDLGINTLTPSGRLHVRSSSNADYVFTDTSTSGYVTTFSMTDTGLSIGHNSASRALQLATNSTARIHITETGEVGIANTSPSMKLSIVGLNSAPSASGSTADGIARLQPTGSTAALDLGFISSPAAAWLQARDSANFATDYKLALNPNGGAVGVGVINPTDQLEVSNGTASVNIFTAKESTTTVFYLPNGMTAPTEQYHILYADDTSGKATWGEIDQLRYRRRKDVFYDHEEFVGRGASGEWGIWTAVETAGGAVVADTGGGAPVDVDHPGQIIFSTNAVGEDAGIYTASTFHGPTTGSDEIDISCAVYFDTVTQTSNNWSFKFGLSDNFLSDASGLVDEIVIYIDPGSNSFRKRIIANSVGIVDTTIGVTAAAGTWYNLRINITNGQAIFIVNSTTSLSLTTTPTVAPMLAVVAYGRDSGTSLYQAHIDYASILVMGLGR